MKIILEDLLAQWRKKQKYCRFGHVILADGYCAYGHITPPPVCKETRPLGKGDFPLGGDEDYGDDPL